MKKLYSAVLIAAVITAAGCGGGKNVKSGSSNAMRGQETGYATIFDNDKSLARDRATDDAMNKLVKVKLGTLVEGKAIVEDFALVESVVEAKSTGMVKDWKVISERQLDANSYEVTIEGTVYPQAVKDTLQATLENYGRPKFMVLINEKFEGKKNPIGSTVAENTIIGTMSKMGFEFVDAAETQKLVAQDTVAMNKAMNGNITAEGDAQNLLANAGAEVIISGDVITRDQTETLKKMAPDTTMKSKSATLNLKAIDVYTGRVLASVSINAPAVHIEDYTASKNAVQQALAKKEMLGKQGDIGDFITTITTGFLKAATRRMIKVNIAGLEYSEVEKFRNNIGERVRGVSKTYNRGSAGRYSVIEVQFAGKYTDFANELVAKADAFGFEVKINQAFPTKIILTAKAKK